MGRIRNLALLIGIMVILLTAVVACSGSGDTPPADEPTQSEAPAQQMKPLLTQQPQKRMKPPQQIQKQRLTP